MTTSDDMPRYQKHLPNQITMARLVLSIAFFVLLAIVPRGATAPGLLTAGFVLYIVAAVTDVLDGHLARRWKVTSAFGRIADPFVDKVIVCGGFALLAGVNFAFGGEPTSHLERQLPAWMHGGMASGVQAWMVVVLIAREFIISGIRGYSESQGISFAATSAGKIKMLIQSVTLCTIFIQLAWLRDADWAAGLKLALVWATVLATVLSGLTYVGRARKLLVEATHG